MQRPILFVLFTFLYFIINGQELSIVSWNLKDFGQSRDDQEIELIAEQLREADIVAIQEVVAKHPGGVQAVARLADALNRKGSKWDYRYSDPTESSSSHKSERYAYLWKRSKVKLTDGAPVLIKELKYNVEREPYMVKFKIGQDELVLLNYHACTHNKYYPERAEIRAITKWIKKQNYDNLVWVGDMNLVIGDEAFKEIRSFGFKNGLNGQKTSLKRKCVNGNYLSRAEDNILYHLKSLKKVAIGILDFIKVDDCSQVIWKRNSYSDHLGVSIILK